GLILLSQWENVSYDFPVLDKLGIKEKFMAADEAIKTTLPIITQRHPDSLYTSKKINTKEIETLMTKETLPVDFVDID
ncbi:27428_t:CDS:2, partial [Racocetra persica]